MLTKRQKKLYRRSMIFLIGDREVDELPKSELRKVQKIGRLIGSDKMDHSKPLPKLNIDVFTWEDYEMLTGDGYTVKSIIEALGVSKYQWMRWRHEHMPEEGDESVCLK